MEQTLVLTEAELVADGFKIMFCVSPICPQPSVSHLYPKPVHRLDALLRRSPLGYRRGCICKRQYISWTLIGQLTFPMSPSGNSQRTQWGRRWREIRLWAIKLMKEGKPKANKTKRAEVIALKALEKCTKTDWQRHRVKA